VDQEEKVDQLDNLDPLVPQDLQDPEDLKEVLVWLGLLENQVLLDLLDLLDLVENQVPEENLGRLEAQDQEVHPVHPDLRVCKVLLDPLGQEVQQDHEVFLG